MGERQHLGKICISDVAWDKGWCTHCGPDEQRTNEAVFAASSYRFCHLQPPCQVLWIKPIVTCIYDKNLISFEKTQKKESKRHT